MSEIYIEPYIEPIGYDHWQTNVSVSQAFPLLGMPEASVTQYFLQRWKWAREATAAATELANETSNAERKAEALRIAKRHDGVWRAVNKLSRKDASTGKEIRACAAVRADAGDATCPTWLEREGRKRSKLMSPVIYAAKALGFTIAKGESSPMTRGYATEVRALFSDASWRARLNIVGADVLTVPVDANTVKLVIVAAFSGSPYAVSCGTATVWFKEHDGFDSVYSIPYEQCISLGARTWIEAQLNRMVDGERQRDRMTCGIFYGKAATDTINRAAELQKPTFDATADVAFEDARTRIETAMAIVEEATKAGDLVAAKAAHGFAVSYADDADVALQLYPLVAAQLHLLTVFDFSGLEADVTMASVHDELIAKVRELPACKTRTANPWRVVGQVTVRGIAELKALAAWMREV